MVRRKLCGYSPLSMGEPEQDDYAYKNRGRDSNMRPLPLDEDTHFAVGYITDAKT